MNKVNKILDCCALPQTDKEKDIVVDLNKVRKRCVSSHESEKRTFIKRSVGKDPILNLTPRQSNKTASRVAAPLQITTPKSSNEQFWSSDSNKQKTTSRFIFQSTQDYSNKIKKVINFSNLNSEKEAHQPSQLSNTQVKITPRIPQLFINRRHMREKQQGTKQEKFNWQASNMMPISMQKDSQNVRLIYREDCFTSNQTMRQTKEISEVSQLKVSPTKDITETRHQSSQIGCAFENSISKTFQKLDKLLQSYGYFERSATEQDNLRREKLQMQKSILQLQLKKLKEQQSYLIKERSFKRQNMAMESNRLNDQKNYWKNRLMEIQSQVNQIRQQIRLRTYENLS